MEHFVLNVNFQNFFQIMRDQCNKRQKTSETDWSYLKENEGGGKEEINKIIYHTASGQRVEG
jgi:hypothetical protein